LKLEYVRGNYRQSDGCRFSVKRLPGPAVDRVMYGSDHPFNPMDWEVAKIVKHAQKQLKLQIEDLRKIMGGNLKRLLGIS
jgi:predicted TIM-barrel fold metal-dependent hydrolase